MKKNSTFQKIFQTSNIKWLMIFLGMIVFVLILFQSVGGYGLKSRSKDTSAQAETIELTLDYAYQNAVWNAQIEQTVRAFNELENGITVSYTLSYEHKVYENTLSRKIARDELGDIVQLKNPTDYVRSGLIAALPEDFPVLPSYTYEKEGRLYGLGAVEATSGILYNKAVFEKLGLSEPQTYDDFLSVCQTLSKNGIVPIGVAGNDLWHMEYWSSHFFRTEVLADHPEWLADCAAGRASWENPEITAMLTSLRELFDAGYVIDDWLAARDSDLPYRMARGEFAMLYTGPWTSAAVTQIDPNFAAGWFYIPDTNDRILAGDNQDSFWAVTADCASDPDRFAAAQTFLEFFYSQDNYSRLCTEACVFPTVETALSDGTGDFYRDLSDAFSSADARISTYIGDADTPARFEPYFLTLLEQYLDGGIDTEEIQDRLQSYWEAAVQKEGAS